MILLDFDGTVVDLWPRYHAVFCTLSGSKIDIYTYKKLKQKIKKDEELFNYLNLNMPLNYFSEKRILLEDTEFLKLDKLIVEKENLIAFIQKNNAKILTSRRHKENFLWELDYLGLHQLRIASVCTNGLKSDWIKSNNIHSGIIIGDDVRDLSVAINQNFSAIMVLSGLGTKIDFVKTKIPHTLVGSLQEISDSLIAKHL